MVVMTDVTTCATSRCDGLLMWEGGSVIHPNRAIVSTARSTLAGLRPAVTVEEA